MQVRGDAAAASAAASAGGAGGGTAAVESVDDGEGRYTLMAIISHIGRNTDHGHYVCHVKKDGHWVLFNDEKVPYLLCM